MTEQRPECTQMIKSAHARIEKIENIVKEDHDCLVKVEINTELNKNTQIKNHKTVRDFIDSQCPAKLEKLKGELKNEIDTLALNVNKFISKVDSALWGDGMIIAKVKEHDNDFRMKEISKNGWSDWLFRTLILIVLGWIGLKK